MPLVELHSVEKHYRLGEALIPAVRGVDLTIEKGEFVAVWGPSGSGKSTLCHLIGVIDEPSKGTVRIDGTDVSELSDDRKSELRNHSIGFVFQSFNLVPVLSALENVMLPLHIQGKPAASAKALAGSLLDEVGLSDHLDHRPHKLSGGQRQRVAIARALVTGPRLVIADEPTANLDTERAERITDLMGQLSLAHGTTFLFSTHDERLIQRARRRIHLRDGIIIEDVRP